MLLEICLLIIGAVAVVLSFVLSERLTSKDKATISLDKVDIEKVAGDTIREKVDLEVDNIIDEKVEKFEIELDKNSNEKILAMGDYSKTILDEIHKNHNEVLFLYNMLKDKEDDIKKSVIDIENIKKSIKAEKNRAENENSNFIKAEKRVDNNSINKDIENNFEKNNEKLINNKEKTNLAENNQQKTAEDSMPGDIEKITAFENKKEKSNNNDRILELMKQGKSIVQIAKELGVGVGEVRLVVDLFKERD